LRPEPLRSDRFRSLEWQSKCTIPVQLAQPTDGTGNSEEDGVVLILGESIVPEKYSRVGVDVRVWVGCLSMFGQDVGHDTVDGVDDLEQFVIGHVLQCKFPLAGVTRVGLTEYSVAVSWNDLSSVERIPCKLGDGVGVDLLSFCGKLGREFLDPFEYLLVGKAVEWSSEGIQSCRVGEVWVGEGGSD